MARTMLVGWIRPRRAAVAEPPIRSYRDLLVWQKALELVTVIYDLSAKLPREEVYGLATQMRRAAISVVSNIAAGHGREHLGDYLRQLSIATGSLAELESHLLVARELAYVGEDAAAPLLERAAEVRRMLVGLTNALRRRATARRADSSPSNRPDT